jgi:hypothetical protein
VAILVVVVALYSSSSAYVAVTVLPAGIDNVQSKPDYVLHKWQHVLNYCNINAMSACFVSAALHTIAVGDVFS